MSARLIAYRIETKGGQRSCGRKHFKPDDLFAQIQKLVERLAVERRAREAAEAADKAKSELLAMVGHELRAPIESVIAMIDLLKASPLDPAQRRYTDMIAQSALSLRPRARRYFRPHPPRGRDASSSTARQFDLHAMLHDVGFDVAGPRERQGADQRLDIGASCPQLVVADEARIRQVLDEPDRHRAEVHRRRLGAPACERRST